MKQDGITRRSTGQMVTFCEVEHECVSARCITPPLSRMTANVWSNGCFERSTSKAGDNVFNRRL